MFRACPPTAASAVAIRNGRVTSIQVVAFTQMAVPASTRSTSALRKRSQSASARLQQPSCIPALLKWVVGRKRGRNCDALLGEGRRQSDGNAPATILRGPVQADESRTYISGPRRP